MICIEDLNVKSILHEPSRSDAATLDQSLGELRRQLTYKSAALRIPRHRGRSFLRINQDLRTLSVSKAKLPLNVRTYRCELLSSGHPPDVNAAANLALWGEAVLVTEAMAATLQHDIQSGDPDRQGPSVTRPRVKGSKVIEVAREWRDRRWPAGLPSSVKLVSLKLEAACNSSVPDVLYEAL